MDNDSGPGVADSARRPDTRDNRTPVPGARAIPIPPDAGYTPDMPQPEQPPRMRFTLLQLLVVMGMLSVLVAIAVQFQVRSKHGSGKCCCVGNLKQLGVSLALYVDRFGGGKEFPNAPGAAFWNLLRTVPAPPTSMLPDNDGLFVCMVKKGAPSPTRIDFTGPRVGSTFPVTDALGANRAIAADLPTNHSRDANDDVNVLLFDGHVEAAPFGSQFWQKAADDTQP